MVRNVEISKEIVISVANKLGVLASVAKVIAEHAVNVEGVAGYEMGSDARIMLVTDDSLRAREALSKAGYSEVKENDVLVLELENKPGSLKSVTARIASEKIDIRYMYGTTCPGTCSPRLIIATTDNAKTYVLLRAH